MLSLSQRVGVLAALLSATTRCQAASFSPPTCVGDITEFPNCEKADSIAINCSDLSKSETIDCFCTQELLNAYIGCKGEFRQCILGDSYDSEVDQWISDWNDACGPYLSDGITTPVASEATRTLDEDACQTIDESCGHLSASITSCSSAYDSPAEITSCRCQGSLVSLASVCDIDGSSSCLGKTAITSNIWEFRNCEAATDVLRTAEDVATITKAPETSILDSEVGATTLKFGSDATTTSMTTSGTVSMGPTLDWIVSLLLAFALTSLL
ncbi:hypothetical protein B0J13DRAFT_527725 [Dactylonectria estremocensis]|uniref:Extracellular membrane protein CFEM domain-containing protein n=1 Tax=Dactylonectria estremocensis TaxID=1079267 RepID=A0A9P9IZW1_9HYPO|nr:hypothetical protein B0J13DRAFT_527725 [Dactylonectria estremocensis]